MKIHVFFDDEIMLRYHRRGASSLFGIYFQHEGTSYPSDDWLDFGATILDTWSLTIEELKAGRRGYDFVFMDGPFKLKATLLPDKETLRLVPRNDNFVWEVPLKTMSEQILQACEKAVGAFERLGIESKEKDSLEDAIKALS